MKSIQRAHIVVVTDGDHGLVLAARLLKMDVAQVTAVAGLDEASGMCQKGCTDACIVAFDEALPDAVPMVENDAPGRKCGVPSLMVAPTVTPYLRKTARRNGYMMAVPVTIAPRMLYRRIGAALQLRRAASRRRRMPGGIVVPVAALYGRLQSANPHCTNSAVQPRRDVASLDARPAHDPEKWIPVFG